MLFCLGIIPQMATGCHPIFFDAFFFHKCINFSLNITSIKKKKRNLETQSQSFPTICILSRL